MPLKNISRYELAVLVFLLVVLVTGFILVYNNRMLFERYTAEDGLIEWLTFTGLLLGAFTCFIRIKSLWIKKSWLFLCSMFIMGLALVFGAGEEISWGQRIFAIQSPEYFRKHNSQAETNIHNLVIGGIRLNRWIFSLLLGSVVAIYVLLLPVLYRKQAWTKRIIDTSGVPLPKVYQSIALILFISLTEVIRHGKRAELLECCVAFILFLIICFPANENTFKK